MTDALAKLQNLPPDTLDKPSAFELAEFQVLQQFYQAWEALHKIPPGKFRQKQKEEAAQRLVELAHVLRSMKNETPVVLVPRFAH